MSFRELVENRQSCRRFDPSKLVEDEKLVEIFEAGRLSPSACNGQPYHITVCRGVIKSQVARATQGPGINGFVDDAPVLLVISEEEYVKSAAIGSKLKKNDYRSIDIGILSAYLTSMAHELGLSTCILGWFNDEKIRSICHLSAPVRLVIALGYADASDTLRVKKRKNVDQLITIMDE